MHELIFVSLEDWDDIWRRNQFVCGEMVRRDEGVRILFVGLPRNASHDLRRGRVGALWRKGTYAAPGVERITVTHPWKWLPDSLPGGRWFNQRVFRRHVKRVARGMGFERPVLWLNPHSAVHLVGRLGEAAVIYDVTDDWSQMEQAPKLKRLIERQDAELCAKADAVIVCSERLAELKRPSNRNVRLIPNGVDAEHYAKVCEVRPDALRVNDGWQRPVLGYTGTVHPDRVDVELVRKVAEGWAGSVVLIGPNFLSAGDAEKLNLPNVHRPGPVPYEQVPGEMQKFDVCIVPHRMTAFTESLNPIKLWEYLAAGKPIVSTDVAGFRSYPDLVRLARTPEQFITACHKAIAEIGSIDEEKLIRERQAIARANSWSCRVDDVEKVISECLVGASAMNTQGKESKGTTND